MPHSALVFGSTQPLSFDPVPIDEPALELCEVQAIFPIASGCVEQG